VTKKQINIQFYKTKYAEFILGSYNNKLCLLDYKYRKMRSIIDDKLKKMLNAEFVVQEDDLLNKTKVQIDEYLMGERKVFSIPLLMVGTEFEKSIWNALIDIPYGQTATYSTLINNNPGNTLKSVSHANGANSIAIIIPCHRILGEHGDLVAYGGGLPLKLKLLNLEQNLFTL